MPTDIDTFFTSVGREPEKLKTLEHIGSDHFPILCEFHINLSDIKQEDEVKTLAPEEEEIVEELIEEGIKEASDNREEVAKEDS